MKRGANITGWYAVRLTYSTGWALYKLYRLAQLRAGIEGHGHVFYMTEDVAAGIRHKEVVT